MESKTSTPPAGLIEDYIICNILYLSNFKAMPSATRKKNTCLSHKPTLHSFEVIPLPKNHLCVLFAWSPLWVLHWQLCLYWAMDENSAQSGIKNLKRLWNLPLATLWETTKQGRQDREHFVTTWKNVNFFFLSSEKNCTKYVQNQL